MAGVGMNAKLQTIMDNAFSVPWMGLQVWKATIVIKPQGHRVNEAIRGLWKPLAWPAAQSRIHQEAGTVCPGLYPVGSWKSWIGAIEGWLWRASASFLERLKHHGAACSHGVTMQPQICCPVTKLCMSHLWPPHLSWKTHLCDQL